MHRNVSTIPRRNHQALLQHQRATVSPAKHGKSYRKKTNDLLGYVSYITDISRFDGILDGSVVCYSFSLYQEPGEGHEEFSQNLAIRDAIDPQRLGALGQ